MTLDHIMPLLDKSLSLQKCAYTSVNCDSPPHLEEDLSHILSIDLNVIKTSMNRDNISLQHKILMMMMRK